MNETKTSLIILLVVLGLVIGGLLTFALIPRTIVKTEIQEKSVLGPERVVEKLVNVEVAPNYKQQVIDALVDDLVSNSDNRYCDGERYKASEILIKKIYDGFTLVENSDGDLEISDVQIKLNFDGGECYETLTCSLDADKNLDC